jgi:hypothetical protein
MFKQIGLFLALACGFSAIAISQQAPATTPQQGAQNVTNGSTELIEQGSYVNRDGESIHRPAHTVSGAAPAGASAQCRDGSYSFSTHHQGTCSHHGGVSQWLK